MSSTGYISDVGTEHELDVSVWDPDILTDVDLETQRLELADIHRREDDDAEMEYIPFTQPTQSPSTKVEIPEELDRLESSTEPCGWVVSGYYKAFIEKLGQSTKTTLEVQHTIERLPLALAKIGSINLDYPGPGTGSIMDQFAHALIVHVWLLVYFRAKTGYTYTSELSLSTYSSSLFLSGYHIYKDTTGADNLTQGEFKFEVEHFETRLRERGGDQTWLNLHLLKDIPEPDLDRHGPRNELAQEYMGVLERGGLSVFALHMLQKEVAREEQDGPRSALSRDAQPDSELWNEVYRQLLLMLISMGMDMVKAIVEGQVSRLAEVPCNAVSNRIRQIEEAQPQPGTYQNCICDGQGLSPTPHHWLRVCDVMDNYVARGHEYDSLAKTIDQLINPSHQWPESFSRLGLRRYTEWKSKLTDHNNLPCGLRRRTVRLFTLHVRSRMAKEIENYGRHVPLIAPVVEYGFGTSPRRRMKAHVQHEHSNYLMNLADASFQYLYPGLFRLQQLIVFACFRPQQCWISEIFVTQIGQGYIKNGGGFSHYAAGFSNGGSYREVPIRIWARLQIDAAEGGLREAVRRNSIDSEERRAMIKRETEEIYRLISQVRRVNQAAQAVIRARQELEGNDG